jgi:hypothetical protein
MQQEDSKTTSKRMTIYECDDFVVDLEYNETFAIIHLPTVQKFTKDTYILMQVRMQEFFEFVTTIGYQNLFVALNDKITEKLAKKLGFAYLGTQDGLNVYVYGELV